MKCILIALLLCSAAPAAEMMTNADVLRLVRAGVSADVILVKIEQSVTSFDTSTDALVQMKSAGTPDSVLKAMLEKQPPPAAPPSPAVPPAPTERCTPASYYTNGTNGWAWYPSMVCVDARGLSIDEQRIAARDLTAECTTETLAFIGERDHELWLATAKETFKLRANEDAVRALSADIAHVAAVAHGDCNSRSLRRLFPVAGK